jgi:hypothetical protein
MMGAANKIADENFCLSKRVAELEHEQRRLLDIVSEFYKPHEQFDELDEKFRNILNK